MTKISHTSIFLSLALSAAALVSHSNAEAIAKRMTIGPPPRTQAQLGDAKADKAASDLEAVVKTYLRGKHIIVAERYFRVDGGTPWSQVSKSVAAERNKLHPLKPGSTTGSRPPWHRMGLDLIDYYPGNPPFAVAMEQGTGGRKSKLVGYFELAAVKK